MQVPDFVRQVTDAVDSIDQDEYQPEDVPVVVVIRDGFFAVTEVTLGEDGEGDPELTIVASRI